MRPLGMWRNAYRNRLHFTEAEHALRSRTAMWPLDAKEEVAGLLLVLKEHELPEASACLFEPAIALTYRRAQPGKLTTTSW